VHDLGWQVGLRHRGSVCAEALGGRGVERGADLGIMGIWHGGAILRCLDCILPSANGTPQRWPQAMFAFDCSNLLKPISMASSALCCS
jgi:hypothetical protein